MLKINIQKLYLTEFDTHLFYNERRIFTMNYFFYTRGVNKYNLLTQNKYFQKNTFTLKVYLNRLFFIYKIDINMVKSTNHLLLKPITEYKWLPTYIQSVYLPDQRVVRKPIHN